MEINVSINRNNAISELICRVFTDEKMNVKIDIQALLLMLMKWDCDYYSILETTLSIPIRYMRSYAGSFIRLVPYALDLQNLELKTIRSMIPRWAGTKYHTAPIPDVLMDIQRNIREPGRGLYLYHSNLNSGNKKSSNNPYVVLVKYNTCIFLDMNRKRAFQYIHQKSQEVATYDASSNM